MSPAVWWSLTGVLSCLFIALAVAVHLGEPLVFDQQILLAMRNPADMSDPLGPPWFEEFMRDISALGSTGVLTLLSLIICCYLFVQQHKRLAWFVLLNISLGMLCSTLLKYGFARPRPDMVEHLSYVYTSSFPSAHSMMSALVYCNLCWVLLQSALLNKTRLVIQLAIALLIVMIGVSRLYLGVHWPTDVIAGWSAGMLWVLVSYRLKILWQTRV